MCGTRVLASTKVVVSIHSGGFSCVQFIIYNTHTCNNVGLLFFVRVSQNGQEIGKSPTNDATKHNERKNGPRLASVQCD